MSASEQRPPRPDLGALRIHRDEEEETRGGSGAILKVIGWIVALAILAGALALAYAKLVVPRRAPMVETMIVKPSVNVANPALLTATGYLVADKQSKITPKISGKVVRLNFDVGDRVKRGDVLAVLESSNLQAQLDEANAALADSQREYARQSALWKQGVTSKALLDSAEAKLQASRARVDGIRISMGDMVVRAPFDGTIATKNTEVGEVISSVTMGQIAGTLPAGAICTIVDLNTLEVVADVNESNISQLHEGQPAEVTVDAFPNQKWKGLLRQIIPTADRAKAIVQVKVKILDPSERLLPEMASTVSFLQTERTSEELQEPQKIWIPESAIAGGNVAVVDKENRVHLKPVQRGAAREKRVEITAGIREGERIVTEKVDELKDGQLVRLAEGS
jgi:RND family efflux transporter MFP subunit